MLTAPTIKKYTVTETKHKKITLTAYIAGALDSDKFNLERRALLICPGGAYYDCANREGEYMATAYLAAGFNTFVLEYSAKSDGEDSKVFPGQLIEAAMAVKFIKENAKELNVNPKYVFVNGYSAGGHLAASLGILYNSEYVKEALGIPDDYVKPAGMVLSYPVITSGEYANRWSIENLLGERSSDEQALFEVSLEKRVDGNTVPAFIWHTRTDNAVPVQNSLLLATALAEHGVPFEMHIYPRGPHGLSLCTDVVGTPDNIADKWFFESVRWMKSIEIE